MPPQSCPSVGVTTLGFHGKHNDLLHNLNLFQRGERQPSLGPTPKTSEVLTALMFS